MAFSNEHFINPEIFRLFVNDDKRFFTIEEADRLVPWLSRKLKVVLEHKMAIEQLVDSHKEFSCMIEVTSDEGFQFMLNNNVQASKVFHAVCLRFYDALQEILDKGLIVKDLDQGLVDFPYWFQGRQVLLCWKLGEKGVLYWHEPEAGFQGRQLIVNLDRVYRKR